MSSLSLKYEKYADFKKMRMKTVKLRESLNGITITDIMSREDYYTVLYPEDLNNIKVFSDVINESVIRDETLNKLFNVISKSKRTLLTIKEILDYLPIDSRLFKTLKKSKSYEHRLYVDICDFISTDFFLELKYFSKDKISNDILIKKAIELTTSLTEKTNGGFVTFENHREFGILFLNAKNGVNITTFKHEMVHYLNWVKRAFNKVSVADENEYKDEVKAIQDNIDKNFTEKNLNYITRSNEYETLLNDFLNILKDIKRKYHKDMNGHDFAKIIVSAIQYRHSASNFDESLEDYFLRLKSLPFFEELKNETSFAMVVFYNMISYKVTNINNHIFGAFSKS